MNIVFAKSCGEAAPVMEATEDLSSNNCFHQTVF